MAMVKGACLLVSFDAQYSVTFVNGGNIEKTYVLILEVIRHFCKVGEHLSNTWSS
jgi:hypothetical protein